MPSNACSIQFMLSKWLQGKNLPRCNDCFSCLEMTAADLQYCTLFHNCIANFNGYPRHICNNQRFECGKLCNIHRCQYQPLLCIKVKHDNSDYCVDHTCARCMTSNSDNIKFRQHRVQISQRMFRSYLLCS